jgi:3-dehydroquinate synthase
MNNINSELNKILKTNNLYIQQQEDYIEIKTTIKSIFETVAFEQSDIHSILDLLIHDKKNEKGKIKFVLLEKIGSFIVNQNVENELIMSSFEDYKL